MELKKTTGYTKEEMLEIARRYSPSTLEVDIIENDEAFVLNLKYGEKQRSAIIYKRRYKSDINPKDEEELLEKIRCDVEEEVKTIILDYGLYLADEIIENFGINELLEDRYKDKNIIYKVKKTLK
ncbi:hypothetical protein DRO97_05675, partial [Archaeoglobales archaeon]